MTSGNNDDVRSGERPSTSVIRSVAVYENKEMTDLPPLYGAIDPDLLDALVESMQGGEVTFPFAGYQVSVSADRTVTLKPDNS